MQFKLLAIVLASAFATSAQASPVAATDWGLHDPVETATFRLRGAFEEIFRFVLADAAQLSSQVIPGQGRDANEKKGGVASLFEERADASDTLMGRFDFGWDAPQAAREFDLQAGRYYFQLVRTGTGSNGGPYDLISSLGDMPAAAPSIAANAVVPEPHGITLALAALAALGWVTQRTQVSARRDGGDGDRTRRSGA